jgi:HAE1 family hydrophobic/amphiphilic exporter-1
MKISRISVEHPSRVAMILIALVVFGIVSVIDMNIEFMGDISLPTIEVLTYYPGAGAKEVERDITDILEKDLITLPHFSNIDSTSTNFVSWITITFTDGVDPYQMLEDVRYRLRMLRDDLPENLQQDPIAVVGEANMIPVFTFSITGENDISQTTQFVKESVEPLLTRIDGVATVEILGGREQEVRVHLRVDDLYANKISALQVMEAIKNSNIYIPLQTATYQDKEVVFQYDGQLQTLKDLKEIPVGLDSNGKIVSVEDVADVSFQLSPLEYYIDTSVESAIVVNVTKRGDGNTLEIAKEIREILQDSPYFSTSSPYSYQIINDDSNSVSASLLTVIRSGLFGLVMAVLVMLFFLADFRATLTISLSIPLSILFTLIGMRVMGVTINLMSLSGMVIALGMVVDASIVMLEHIIKVHDERSDLTSDEAIILGSSQVSSPILASTSTTIAVFVPLSLLTGIIGSILRDTSLTLILSLTASFFVAIIVVPFILHIVLKKKMHQLRAFSFFSRAIIQLAALYKKALSWALDHRKFILFITVSALVATLFAIQLLGVTFIPSTDTGEFYVDISYPVGTSVERTRELSLVALERVKASVPEIESVTLFSGLNSGFGFSSPNESYMRVILNDVEDRERSVTQIIENTQLLLSQSLVDANVRVTNGGFDKLVGYVSDGGGYALTLEGEDLRQLYDSAREIELVLQQTPSVLSTDLDTSYDSTTLSIVMGSQLMASLGIHSVESGLTSSILFNELEVGEFKTQDGVYPIMLDSTLSKEDITSSTLLQAHIMSSDGRVISFASLGELQNELSVNRINHKGRMKTITVSANLASEDTSTVNQAMSEYLATHPLPPGIQTSSGGLIKLIKDSLTPMIQALLIAIFLVYMVMVLQFEFFKQPFIVMASIPFTLIGVILGLLMFGSSISLLSFMAIIALSGMVVNNGILLIDSINVSLQNGSKEDDFSAEKLRIKRAISSASAVRLRPILMTTLTTLLGVIPMAFALGEASSLYAPLGQAIAGGLISSTFLTLFVIPIFYYINEVNTLKRERGSHEA